MISNKTLKSIEYDKILAILSSSAVLERTKNEILTFMPHTNIVECKAMLDRTEEAFRLLYDYNLCSAVKAGHFI